MQWQGLNAGYMLKKNIYLKIYSKIKINHIVCIDLECLVYIGFIFINKIKWNKRIKCQKIKIINNILKIQYLFGLFYFKMIYLKLPFLLFN